MNFPTLGSKNIKLYYFLTIFMNGWFILPNWVFYYSQFITIPVIGFIDGISKVFGIVLEVPSGAISDLFGKKKTLILGNLSLVASCIFIIFASGFTELLIGNILMFFGFAFNSGSKEALLYDSLVDINGEDHYDEILGKVASLATASTIFSVFMGGILFGVDPRLPFVAYLIFCLINIWILLFINEPKSDQVKVTLKGYFAKLKDGTTSIFKKSFINFILPVLFFSMLAKSYHGVIRQNTGAYFGFTGETFGYLISIILIPTLLFSYNYKKLVTLFQDKIEYLFLGLYLFGFLVINLSSNMYVGVISFLGVYIAQEILNPFIIGLVNKNIDSKHRATSLSTVALFAEIPYIIVVTFFGGLIVVESIRYVYIGFMAAIVLYLVLRIFGKKA